MAYVRERTRGTVRERIGDDAAPAAAVSGTVLVMIAGVAALALWPDRKRRGRR